MRPSIRLIDDCTGTQRVLSMEWGDIDVDAALWFIYADENKSKRDQTVLLPLQV
ncbi:MAG: hypothetical protein ABGZ35_27320 [Planctomycetaceae bacterium]